MVEPASTKEDALGFPPFCLPEQHLFWVSIENIGLHLKASILKFLR
jgi:hypothetical protein